MHGFPGVVLVDLSVQGGRLPSVDHHKALQNLIWCGASLDILGRNVDAIEKVVECHEIHSLNLFCARLLI